MSQSQPSQTPSSTTPTSSSLQSMTPEERKEKLTQCLLSQYRLCAAGVITGAGYSVLRRATVRPGPWPMLAGGFGGTLGDFIFGYFVECAHLRESDKIFEVKEGGRR
mmetsp:Transcript_35843/g.61124  ORF Transcript_35843/g.61124 Transcript_35843/m.61124 type:complete len:107 (-) Transcript_35843:417-737(-)|eukprot:CAMPEP_0183707536 /NCGR_PEP_ID=MMETSP0737-20130205/4086_1 /TAXON_ID=385413 /ORGANISM="Thalassiosira miniscula, Strain CCMP1093" /LENGTH=106 /DNA_ID=CAMNT_0025935227 /DNA_START=55 /DNA_END=375 /DNA_ORIENTATION=-